MGDTKWGTQNGGFGTHGGSDIAEPKWRIHLNLPSEMGDPNGESELGDPISGDRQWGPFRDGGPKMGDPKRGIRNGES